MNFNNNNPNNTFLDQTVNSDIKASINQTRGTYEIETADGTTPSSNTARNKLRSSVVVGDRKHL